MFEKLTLILIAITVITQAQVIESVDHNITAESNSTKSKGRSYYVDKRYSYDKTKNGQANK